MLIKIILLNLLLISQVFADVMGINYGLFNYQFEQTPALLTLRGKNLDLTFKATLCNKKLFNQFLEEVKEVKRIKRHFLSSISNSVEVKLDKETFYVEDNSPEGLYFLNFVERFKKLKIQNKLLCPE